VKTFTEPDSSFITSAGLVCFYYHYFFIFFIFSFFCLFSFFDTDGCRRRNRSKQAARSHVSLHVETAGKTEQSRCHAVSKTETQHCTAARDLRWEKLWRDKTSGRCGAVHAVSVPARHAHCIT
jgi:hypothetical protein